MPQKREIEDLGERLDRIEQAVNTLKSRLSAIEERLMDLEFGRKGGKGDGDTLDLSQVPIDHKRNYG